MGPEPRLERLKPGLVTPSLWLLLTSVAGRLVGLLHKVPAKKFLIATDSNRTREDEAAGTAAVVLRRGQEGHFEAARGSGRADRSSLEADSVTFRLRGWGADQVW